MDELDEIFREMSFEFRLFDCRISAGDLKKRYNEDIFDLSGISFGLILTGAMKKLDIKFIKITDPTVGQFELYSLDIIFGCKSHILE